MVAFLYMPALYIFEEVCFLRRLL